MQAAPSDVPNGCPTCRQMTLHRPGPDGRLYCLLCMMRPSMPMAPSVQPPPRPQVIQMHQQPEGGVMRGTITFAKFVFALIFLLCIGTCVYTCGAAATSVSNADK